MTSVGRFIVHLTTTLLVTLLTGLIVRQHYRRCLSFTLYVLAVILSSVLIGLWPDRFYRWDFYILKELVHNLLKFAVALELAYRAFRSFPGALASMRRILFIVVIAVGVTALAAWPPNHASDDIDIEWQTRLLNGTIWVFTGVAAMILWYRLPVHPFHKAILVGFVPYLLVFSLGLRALVEMGEAARWLQRTHTLAYVALLLYWNRAAWSRAPALVASPRPAPAEQPEPA